MKLFEFSAGISELLLQEIQASKNSNILIMLYTKVIICLKLLMILESLKISMKLDLYVRNNFHLMLFIGSTSKYYF